MRIPVALARAAVLLVGLRAGAAPPPGSLWEISLEGSLGIPRGEVQVRENQLEGTRLDLHDDLGVHRVESFALDVVRRLDPASAIRVRFDALLLDGDTSLAGDVLFNGATLQGGTDLSTRPDFFRVTALYERRVAELPNGGSLAGEAGLTYVFLEFRLQGTLSPETHGAETQEDFLTQELPVPVVGLRLDLPLGGRWRLSGRLEGGYLPRVYSLRNEGGKVDLSQAHVDVAIALRYGLTRGLDLEGGFRFSYFVQHEISAEDDNYIRVSSGAATLAVLCRF